MPKPEVVASNTVVFSSTRTPTTGTISAWTPQQNDLLLTFWATASSTTMPTSGGVPYWPNVGTPPGSNTSYLLSSFGGQPFTAGCVFHAVTYTEQLAGTVAWSLTNLFSTSQSGRTLTVVVRGGALPVSAPPASYPWSPVDRIARVASGATTSHPLSGVTPNTDGCLVVSFLTANDTNTWTPTVSPWTVVLQTGTTRAVLLASYNDPTVAGMAISNVSVTHGGSAAASSMAVAILPSTYGPQSQGFFSVL